MAERDLPYQSWFLPEALPDEPLSEIDLPLCLKAVLIRRGLKINTQAREFLKPSYIPNPEEHYPDLKIAIDRLKVACINNEGIAICGDYDADGMTSTALLLKAFRSLNAFAIAAIPNRLEEGYGLNDNMVSNLHTKGIKVIITVDNGINAFESIQLANDYNIDVILTDHHQLNNTAPKVLALIHPSTTPQSSPYRNLAGVGLAYLIAIGLAKEFKAESILKDSLDLFCLGTIADMSSLRDSNRYFLINGLKNMHNTQCLGLKALYKVSGLENCSIRADDIGFQIAPRINAVGRIGDPNLILRLLLETDKEKAASLAKQCDELNKNRKLISKTIESEAVALIEADNGAIPPFILIAQSHWHAGVVGIVASRLVEKYNRPTALLALSKDGRFRASVRAPAGFSVNKALELCSDNLDSHGGHPAAGGFTVKPENISTIHKQLNVLANSWLQSHGRNFKLTPDSYLSLNEITWKFWDLYSRLGPFGIGNLRPLFWTRNCEVISKKILRGGHLSLLLSQDDQQITAIYWNFSKIVCIPQFIDIAFYLNISKWSGVKKFQLELKSIRPYQNEVIIKKSNRTYKSWIKNTEEAILINNKHEEILFSINTNNISSNNQYKANDPYIKELISDATIALGLTV